MPEPIAALASFNALALTNVHWREDVARLFDHIKEAIYARGVALAGGSTVAADFTPDAPKSASLGWVFAVLMLFFVIFGGVAAWLGYETLAFRAQASSAEGEVVALRRHVNDEGAVLFRPEVVFAPDGGEAVGFVGSVGSNPPAYSVGERVRVLYDPARPGDARLDDASAWLLPAIFGLFAAIFGGVVGVMLWLRVRKRRRFRRLRVEGRPIVTTFERVEQITSITVNDRHPYVIVSNWRHPVTGRMVEFRSEHIWDDPTQEASKRMITVVIDPEDFGNYMMDLGFLGRGR